MFIADLHIHSKYSGATSGECVPEVLDLWARRKGLHLIGTGDFTHPKWREELREKLIPAEEGLYRLKSGARIREEGACADQPVRFVVSGEISSIYKKNGKVRKVHNVILLPGLEHADALSRRLEASFNLHSDGRPILGLDSRDLLEITLSICPEAIFIPAHIWTPHFSLFGAYSGFDRIEECFEDLTGHIHALETGLSSDPPMNWRLSMLDRFTLVSNSDAHSPANLAREANIFHTELAYPHISRALSGQDADAFLGTIEFFPEEGKYHYDGHRACGVCQRPADTKASQGVCPVCGGRITVGVLSRVEDLADRPEGFRPPSARQFESLVPLHEVIAASFGVTSASVKVRKAYGELVSDLGPELYILREAPLEEISRKAGVLIAEGIRRLRTGKVDIQPGFDGEYGKIKLFDKGEADLISGQLSFLGGKTNTQPSVPKKSGPKGAAPSAAPAELPQTAAEPSKPSPAGIPYGLNPEQWEAVCARDSKVAVIAGPGTGKTKTLVSRILYLVETCGVPPSHITAVTFTNKAAGEMRARLEKQLRNKRAVKAMTIGTFHAICLRLLSGEKGQESLPVIDEADALSIIADILKELRLKDAPRDVLRMISLQKNGAEPADKGAAIPEGVFELYCQRLQNLGVLDYDDILVKALALSDNWGNLPPSFDHLLVDEFQDINDIQYRLIKAWSRNSADVFVIGDPDQSIYGFRGADSRCFDKFFEEFPLARRVRLTRNYRSTVEILRCAETVLPKETGEVPQLEATRGSGVPVRLVYAEDELAQAQYVASEIKSMVGGIDMLEAHDLLAGGRKPDGRQGRGFADIALLYRTNRQAQALERCLKAESIPYRVTGREDFLGSPKVRRAIAFFRILLNPGDLVSLRMLLVDAGLQPEAVQQVLEGYTAGEKSLSFLAALLEKLDVHSEGLEKFLAKAKKFAPLIPKGKPAELVEAWANDNGLSGNRELELFINSAVMHDSMASFLVNLTLGQEGDMDRSGGRRYTPDAVSLMTLHGAKGLEFPVVFLCGVAEGLIPFIDRDGGCNLPEERRLFYVGMTRAQDELVLMALKEPSPFLEDLPQELLATSHACARKQAPAFEQFSFFDVGSKR